MGGITGGPNPYEPNGFARLKLLALSFRLIGAWCLDGIARFIVWAFHGRHAPEAGCFEKVRRWVRSTVMWTSTTAVLYLITLWSPFGFSAVTDQISADIFYRVIAGPGFERQNPSANPGRNSVLDEFAVVLVVEDDLKSLRERWPTRYRVHADVLGSLDELGARAVVVDIALLDDRTKRDLTNEATNDPAYDATYEALQFILGDMWAREGEAVPVFLAMPREDTGGFREPIGQFVDVTPEIERDTNDKEKVYPCALVSVPGGRSTRDGRLYELFQREQAWQGDVVEESGPPVWSAALAAYLATRDGWDMATDCRDWARWPLAEALPVGTQPDAPSPARMMEVVWAVRDFEFTDESGTYRNNGLFRCKPAIDRLIDRFARVARDNLVGVASDARQTGLSSSLLQVCGPFPTVNAHTLIDLTKKNPEEWDKRQRAIHDMVNGRVVFYGAAVTAVEDRVEPPTHAPLPAVYFHAMAAANLLAYEEDYKRPGRHWLGIPVNELLLIAIIAMGILIRSSARYAIEADWRRHRSQPGHRRSVVDPDPSEEREMVLLWLRSIGVVVIAMLFYFVFVGTVTFVAWSDLNLAPVNFVAAFSLEIARNLTMQKIDIQMIEDQPLPS